MSRIHLTIEYKRPIDEQRKEIWNNLFDKLEIDQESDNSSQSRGHYSINNTDVPKKPPHPRIRIMSTARNVVLEKESYSINFQINARDIRNSEL